MRFQHCFWDRSEDIPFRADMFQVSVGKTYRDYVAREEYKPQFFSVEQVLFIDGYNDLAGYYSDDIALLVLDKHIEFHSFITPICLPQNLQYEVIYWLHHRQFICSLFDKILYVL